MNDGDIKVIANKFYWEYVRQDIVSLLVYGPDRSYFKQKNNITKCWRTAFFFYFLKKKEMQHKTHINNQKQEAFMVIIISYTFSIFLLCLLYKKIFFEKY